LERAVVALVEAPRPAHGDPLAVAGLQRQVGGPDRPLEDRGVDYIGQQAAVPQQLAGVDGLGLPPGGQADVDPAGEQAEGVPVALTVAQQDESVAAAQATTSATASIIPENSSGLRLAPPTRQPSQASSPTYD